MRRHQFTIYDKMEQDGVFDSNPANVQARGPQGQILYKGPVKWPKMVYHPEGKMRVTTPATAIATPFGPQMVGEQKELVWKIVENEDEYKAAKAEGWHDTPTQSLAAAPKESVGTSSSAPQTPSAAAEMAAAADLATKDAIIEDLKRKLAEAGVPEAKPADPFAAVE